MIDKKGDNIMSGHENENSVLSNLAFASLVEQTRARRWGVFFKSAILLALIGAAISVNQIAGKFSSGFDGVDSEGNHSAVVDIKGSIAENDGASSANVIKGLRDSFKDKNTKGIILRINSSGGSPVQAGYIYDEIKRLRSIYPGIKVYAVITDIGASAAYYIASAADEIYADKASIVGSIGVITAGYGFVGVMEKLGVERRVLTAGENKGFLDPFTPMKDEHKAHMQSLLDNVHKQFIDAVKSGRGDRLSDNPQLNSGLVWSGEQSLELGLVDGLASASKVARDIIGAEKITDFTPGLNYIDRFAGMFGSSISEELRSKLFQKNIF